jgi:hypothetical protein
MRYNVTIFLFSFYILICCNGNGQKKGINQKKTDHKIKIMKKLDHKIRIMKKLDIKKFEKYKSGNKFEYTENDTVYTLASTGNDNEYCQSIKAINKNFKDIFIYDKSTLNLKREGLIFLKMPIGIHVFYDEKGKVNKQIDFDEGFTFTIDDLILKMKKNFNIDISQELKGLEISRGINQENSIPSYNIFIRLDNILSKNRHIEVDGRTGEIISDKIVITEG